LRDSQGQYLFEEIIPHEDVDYYDLHEFDEIEDITLKMVPTGTGISSNISVESKRTTQLEAFALCFWAASLLQLITLVPRLRHSMDFLFHM
jgi:hypothetical protein